MLRPVLGLARCRFSDYQSSKSLCESHRIASKSLFQSILPLSLTHSIVCVKNIAKLNKLRVFGGRGVPRAPNSPPVTCGFASRSRAPEPALSLSKESRRVRRSRPGNRHPRPNLPLPCFARYAWEFSPGMERRGIFSWLPWNRRLSAPPALQALAREHFDERRLLKSNRLRGFEKLLDELHWAADHAVVYSDVMDYIDWQKCLAVATFSAGRGDAWSSTYRKVAGDWNSQSPDRQDLKLQSSNSSPKWSLL